MARNKINDLRNHLFAQLERLSDDELMSDPETKKIEIDRAKAMTGISNSIIQTAKTEMDFIKLLNHSDDYGVDVSFINRKPDQKKIE